MQICVIAKSEPYTLTSFGNGWGYVLAHADGRSVWLQDDDALQFREEYDAYDSQPDADQASTLSALWDTYKAASAHSVFLKGKLGDE